MKTIAEPKKKATKKSATTTKPVAEPAVLMSAGERGLHDRFEVQSKHICVALTEMEGLRVEVESLYFEAIQSIENIGKNDLRAVREHRERLSWRFERALLGLRYSVDCLDDTVNQHPLDYQRDAGYLAPNGAAS